MKILFEDINFVGSFREEIEEWAAGLISGQTTTGNQLHFNYIPKLTNNLPKAYQ